MDQLGYYRRKIFYIDGHKEERELEREMVVHFSETNSYGRSKHWTLF